MMREFEKQKLPDDPERPHTKTAKLGSNNAIVVDSDFIIQAEYYKHVDQSILPTDLGVFAPSETAIIRGRLKSRQSSKKRETNPGEITHLKITLNYNQPDVFIGDYKVSLIERNINNLIVEIDSPTPLQLKELDNRLIDRNKDINNQQAQRILNLKPSLPTPMDPALQATKSDIKNRRRFQIDRALNHLRDGNTTREEKEFLRKMGEIPPFSQSSYRRKN